MADASPTVLVVDDELLIRWTLRERLGEAGYRVIEASSGRDAREKFNGEVGAVILDIRLPDIDGFELLEEFRASHPECPVLMISAHATREIVDRALRSGAFDLLPKPFDVERILREVQRALRDRGAVTKR